MTSHPILSIVTVTRNAARDLLATMENVAQVYQGGVEHIVVDGMSNDGTRAILKEFNLYPVNWISEPDEGIYDAMNKGASMATGQWIVFINAGDLLAIEDFNKILNLLKTAQENLLFFRQKTKSGAIVSLLSSPFSMPASHQAQVVKADFFNKIKFNLKYKVASDFYFYKKYAINSNKVFYSELFLSYETEPGFSKLNYQKMKNEYSEIISEVDGFFLGLLYKFKNSKIYLACIRVFIPELVRKKIRLVFKF
ncbi:WcaA Glycosyltransferases involved in cell wall biogenesis [Methylophilaceae bacterium]